MKTRIISGVVITVLCVVLGFLGGWPLGAVLGACSVIGYIEVTRALAVHEQGKPMNVLEYLGIGCVVLFWGLLIYLEQTRDMTRFFRDANFVTLLVIIAILCLEMMVYVFTFPLFHADQVIDAIFSFVYVAVMMSCIFRARSLPFGMCVYALIFFCSWVCDTCAWAVGRKFGKHKLAPVLSPKKSVEGAVGGAAGSAIACLIMAVAVHHFMHISLEREFLILGVAGGIISQVGDLTASAIKRNHGIKDYGRVIPGHGGIMDRFDSAIFTAPVVYYLAVWLLTVHRNIVL